MVPASTRRLRSISQHLTAPPETKSQLRSAAVDSGGGGIVDLEFFEKNGYVVVPSVVPLELVERVKAEMALFLGMADIAR